MKLSAKWLTALAALALFAVVMVGIQDRSAEAGTTGNVYLTNKWSSLTNESNPPSADKRTYVGSGNQVFASVLTGEYAGTETKLADAAVTNSIRQHANVVTVTVVDPDADVANAPNAMSGTVPAAGQDAIISLDNDATADGTGPPAVDSDRDGSLMDEVLIFDLSACFVTATDCDREGDRPNDEALATHLLTLNDGTTTLTLANWWQTLREEPTGHPTTGYDVPARDTDGDPTNDTNDPPRSPASDYYVQTVTGDGTVVTVGRPTANTDGAGYGLFWKTSVRDSLDVTLSSGAGGSGDKVTVTLWETDRSSGRFEGDVELVLDNPDAVTTGANATSTQTDVINLNAAGNCNEADDSYTPADATASPPVVASKVVNGDCEDHEAVSVGFIRAGMNAADPPVAIEGFAVASGVALSTDRVVELNSGATAACLDTAADCANTLGVGGTAYATADLGSGSQNLIGFFPLNTPADRADTVLAARKDGRALSPYATMIVSGSDTLKVEYKDTSPTGTAASRTVSSTAKIDTSAPQPVITAPENKVATQDRSPSFSGTVFDGGAGLQVGTITLYIDESDDKSNGQDAITNTAPGVKATDAQSTGVAAYDDDNGLELDSSPKDGASSVTWSSDPGSVPCKDDTSSTGCGNFQKPVNHMVDYIVVATDLAGNVGYSDSDADTKGVQHNVVHIDQQIPVLTAVMTGVYYDPDAKKDAAGNTEGKNKRDSIVIRFDNAVEGVDAEDILVTLGDKTPLVPSSVETSGSNVYLMLDSNLPSDDTPTVALQGQISDKAGNTTSSGSKVAVDGLAPVISVVLSGGSGTGDGKSGPDALTKKDMLITVSSDEALSRRPVVQIWNGKSESAKIGDCADEDNCAGTVGATGKGGNAWEAKFDGSTSVGKEGTLTIRVLAQDEATPNNNMRTFGTDDPDKGVLGSTKFVLDETAPGLVTANTTTSQSRPSVQIEFDEVVAVNMASLGDAVLANDDEDEGDVVNELTTANDKLFFHVPAEDLELGKHTVMATATDLAGNQVKEAKYTLTIADRKTFDLAMFFGWNAVSFPSEPLDPDINSVFSNDTISQVVAYDATDADSPWRIATRDAVSGAWTSTTETPLSQVSSTMGYWVHSASFEAQNVELAGPISEGGQAPSVVSIPTGAGWNFVGVIDTTRANTEGASGGTTSFTAESYFASVDARKAYKYMSASQSYNEVRLGRSSDNLNWGDGIWVFIVPQNDGSLPDIAP